MKRIFICIMAAMTALGVFANNRQKTPMAAFKSESLNEIERTKVDVSDLKTQALKLNTNFAKRAPRLANNDGSIYGYLYYSRSYDDLYGLYEYNGRNFEMVWEDPIYSSTYISPDSGWLNDGKVSGVSIYWFFGMIAAYYSYDLDFQTGQLLNFTLYDHYAFDVMFSVCKLNPDDGMIYGYALDLEKYAYYWAKANPETPDQIEEIKKAGVDVCSSLCYNEKDECFYGVTSDLYFVRIDLDGNQTVVAEIPAEFEVDPDYVSGLVWDPVENIYYWNMNRIDESSALYTITPEGEFENKLDFINDEQYSYYFTTAKYVNQLAPLPAEVESINFEGGNLTGTITYKLPTTYGNGNPLTTSINYILAVDGVETGKGSGAPGSSVDCEYSVPEDGVYTLSIVTELDGEKSKATRIKKYIGFDVPNAPTNVNLTASQITWNAVTSGIEDGYVDVENMQYEVILNGKTLGTTKETSYDITLSTTDPLQSYVAEIYAISHDKKSEPGISNNYVTGKPADLTILYTPTEEQYDFMTKYDANRDGDSWFIGDNGYLYSGYTNDPDRKMDDFIFLPPVEFSKDERYYLSFNAGLVNWDFMREYYRVILAKTPNPEGIVGNYLIGSTQPFNSPTEDNNYSEWDYAETQFSVPESGTYYVGFWCVSEGAGYGIMFKDFLLTPSSTPAKAEKVEAVRGEKGALHATVTVTFPEKSLNGKDLPEGAKLTAKFKVNGEDVDQVLEGTPGSKGTIVLETVQGDNDIDVFIHDERNYYANPYSLVVFTGVDIPAAPSSVSLTVNPDMVSGRLRWSAVTQPEDPSGYLDPALITYDIWVYSTHNSWEVYETGIKGTTYEIVMEEGAQQAQYGWGVSAHNAAGSGEFTPDYGMMGTPYPIPFIEDFSDDGPTMEPWFRWPIDGQTTVELFFEYLFKVDPSFEDSTDIAITGAPITNKLVGLLSMPRFSTKNVVNPQLVLNYMAYPDNAAVRIYANIYNNTRDFEIGYIPAKDSDVVEIKEYTFDLPAELWNQDWVQVYYYMTFPNKNSMFVLRSVEGIDNKEGGIFSLTADTYIAGGNNQITLKGFEGENIKIFSVDGKLVKEFKANSNNMNVSIEKGIYIVKAADRSSKIIVR